MAHSKYGRFQPWELSTWEPDILPRKTHNKRVKYRAPMLKAPRVESDHILIGPSGKDKSSYLGVKTMENVFKMFPICF